MRKILLIGYGNPGRLDDGLGPALAERLEKMQIGNLTVDSDYQLHIENAKDISEHDVVIFADASLIGKDAYYFNRIEPKAELGFTSHNVEPEAVLGMAHDMFNAKTEGYVFGIRGYAFNEFGETISKEALDNLDKATKFIVERIKEL